LLLFFLLLILYAFLSTFISLDSTLCIVLDGGHSFHLDRRSTPSPLLPPCGRAYFSPILFFLQNPFFFLQNPFLHFLCDWLRPLLFFFMQRTTPCDVSISLTVLYIFPFSYFILAAFPPSTLPRFPSFSIGVILLDAAVSAGRGVFVDEPGLGPRYYYYLSRP
jgi:hypothetical protein